MPCGKKMPTKRGFGVAAVAASAVDAGIIASSSGSASVHPALFRNVRRGRCFFAIYMAYRTPLRSFAAGAAADVGVAASRGFMFIWNGLLLTTPRTSDEKR